MSQNQASFRRTLSSAQSLGRTGEDNQELVLARLKKIERIDFLSKLDRELARIDQSIHTGLQSPTKTAPVAAPRSFGYRSPVNRRMRSAAERASFSGTGGFVSAAPSTRNLPGASRNRLSVSPKRLLSASQDLDASTTLGASMTGQGWSTVPSGGAGGAPGGVRVPRASTALSQSRNAMTGAGDLAPSSSPGAAGAAPPPGVPIDARRRKSSVAFDETVGGHSEEDDEEEEATSSDDDQESDGESQAPAPDPTTPGRIGTAGAETPGGASSPEVPSSPVGKKRTQVPKKRRPGLLRVYNPPYFIPVRDIDYLEKVYSDIQNASNGPVSLPAFRRYFQAARAKVNLKRVSLNQIMGDLYRLLDRHRRDHVSFEDMVRAVYPRLSDDDVKGMFVSLDINTPGQDSGDQEIDEEEKEELKAIFALWDTDTSGQLGYEEIVKVLQPLMSTLEIHEIRETLAMMDKDGDGQISVEEFFNFWRIGRADDKSNLGKKMNQIGGLHRQYELTKPLAGAAEGGDVGATAAAGARKPGTRPNQQIDMAEVRKTRDPVFVLSSYVQKRGEQLEFAKRRKAEGALL